MAIEGAGARQTAEIAHEMPDRAIEAARQVLGCGYRRRARNEAEREQPPIRPIEREGVIREATQFFYP